MDTTPALELAREWDSENCPACGSAKWAHHPFCRHCSIRLQRIGLMRRFNRLAGYKAGVIIFRKDLQRMSAWWTRYYDLCRDYLIVSSRERKASHQ